MKLLTVAIPCYNSESYMEHAVETALCGGEEIEILLVNDGSTDKTAEIADRLAAEHPTINNGNPQRKRRPRQCRKCRTC